MHWDVYLYVRMCALRGGGGGDQTENWLISFRQSNESFRMHTRSARVF